MKYYKIVDKKLQDLIFKMKIYEQIKSLQVTL